MKPLKMIAMMLSVVVGTQVHAATDQEIIKHISYNVILATFNDLADQAGQLKIAVDNLAVSQTQDNLTVAQNAWRATRIPWEANEAFLFGPADSLGLDPMMDTWPLNKLDLDAVLAGKNAINIDLIHALGTNLQGFHTIEYLLFGDGKQINNKPVASLTPKQIDYLKATSAVLVEHATALAQAWSTNYDPEDASAPGYVAMLSNPGMNNRFYSSERAVMEEFIQGMMKIADEVANGKIADPMGGDINSANMALVESPFSWNSLNDFTFNIRSIYSVYTGTYGQSKGPGVQAMVARYNPALATKIEQDILKCMQLIQAIRPSGGGDFGQAIFTQDGRARTDVAVNALHDLYETLHAQVLPLLDR